MAASPSKGKRWSQRVTETSDALDLDDGVFAKRSKRRKSSPYRSAMSMLTFYINRAGKNLPKSRLDVLNRAKGALREAFGRT